MTAGATSSRSTSSRPAVTRAVAGMPPSDIRKFFDIVMTMDDVLSLGVGEPDFVTP